MRSFYQDRLETNTGKALTKTLMFSQVMESKMDPAVREYNEKMPLIKVRGENPPIKLSICCSTPLR
eukprot:COSAG06_NODE_34_length_31045_cov_28.806469_12_plen_66_part_00